MLLRYEPCANTLIVRRDRAGSLRIASRTISSACSRFSFSVSLAAPIHLRNASSQLLAIYSSTDLAPNAPSARGARATTEEDSPKAITPDMRQPTYWDRQRGSLRIVPNGRSCGNIAPGQQNVALPAPKPKNWAASLEAFLPMGSETIPRLRNHVGLISSYRDTDRAVVSHPQLLRQLVVKRQNQSAILACSAASAQEGRPFAPETEAVGARLPPKRLSG